jgi:hypothetical protein
VSRAGRIHETNDDVEVGAIRAGSIRGTNEDVDVVEADSVKVRPVGSDAISLSYHEQ